MLLLTLCPKLCSLFTVHVGVKSCPEKSAVYKYNDYLNTLLKLQYCTLEHLTHEFKKKSIDGENSFRTELNSLTNTIKYESLLFIVHKKIN